MNCKQPIGFFDSGIGGLTVAKEVSKLMPNEELVYISDSYYAPYGTKNPDFVTARSLQLCRHLQSLNVKMIVVACNTATAWAINRIRAEIKIPVIAMEPGIKPAAMASKTRTLGILATPGTIKSTRYIKLSEHYADQVKIISQPCAGLVELIEQNQANSDKMRKLLEKYILPLKQKKIDQLVLGCTHYPLLKPLIKKIAGKDINIVDTGPAVAKHVQDVLRENQLKCTQQKRGRVKILTSMKTDNTASLINNILSENAVIALLDVNT